MSTLADIEARRAARKERVDAARAAQDEVDLEGLDAAEEEYGHLRVTTVETTYTEGLPRRLVVRTPKPIEFKRFRDMCERKQEAKAAELLADVCVVYPAGDVLARVWEANPGAREHAAVVAVKMAQGREAGTGKG